MTHNQSDQNSAHTDEQLYAYFDNELTPTQREEFETSLRSSPNLQQRLAALQTLSSGLHQLNDESKSDHPQPLTLQSNKSNPINSTSNKRSYPRWMPYAALIASAAINPAHPQAIPADPGIQRTIRIYQYHQRVHPPDHLRHSRKI